MTETKTTQGLEALSEIFTEAKKEKRSAFLPYFPIGYPDYESSLDAIQAMAEVGVDGFEIGVPFSDPLADGPTIQAATQIALENGTTVKKCLEAVSTLRERGVSQPMMMMSYLNPLLRYGIEDFIRDAKTAGADGFIIPDLPPEEADHVLGLCADAEMALALFLAPTSNTERVKLVASKASGFIYVVSLTGVTGARTELPAYLTDFIGTIRAETDVPLVMGFGISTPEHVRVMHSLVDGYIVGSALVKAGKDGVGSVRELADRLRQA